MKGMPHLVKTKRRPLFIAADNKVPGGSIRGFSFVAWRGHYYTCISCMVYGEISGRVYENMLGEKKLFLAGHQ